MQKYNLCIIDDKIPVEEFIYKIEINNTGIIDKNILTNYLRWAEETVWSDTNLYNLIKRLMERTDLELNISGFTSHSFYFNHIEECLYSPDIIIFDWDIGASEIPPEESLKTILLKTYCLVAIYTGYDKKNEINTIIQGEEFKPFNSRVFIIEKDEVNSAEVVIDNIKSHLDDFSLKYGRDFKHSINVAINTTFSTIGGLSFDQFIKVFGEFDNDEKKYRISSLDFIDIMSEQIKAHLMSSRTIESLIAPETSDNILVEKQLWHFRMLHEPQDNIVRKGDIVWSKTKNKYYFIVSTDCHLGSFWSKNLGYLTIIPLYRFDDKDFIQRIKQDIHPDSLKQFKISSLVNPQMITGITIIPCLDKENDYIFSPKEIVSISISQPKNRKILMYEDMPDFDSGNRFRLNEPFLSSLIEFTLRNITDIGVPDYSGSIKNSLKEIIRKCVE